MTVAAGAAWEAGRKPLADRRILRSTKSPFYLATMLTSPAALSPQLLKLQ